MVGPVRGSFGGYTGFKRNYIWSCEDYIELRDIVPVMENQLEKNMEDEMETGLE